MKVRRLRSPFAKRPKEPAPAFLVNDIRPGVGHGKTLAGARMVAEWGEEGRYVWAGPPQELKGVGAYPIDLYLLIQELEVTRILAAAERNGLRFVADQRQRTIP